MLIKSITLFLLTAVIALAVPRFSSVRQSLEHWEGVRYVPYADPARPSHMIVGIGRNLTSNNQGVRLNRRYSPAEVYAFYDADFRAAVNTARAGIVNFDGLENEVKQVVINLVWTVGPSGFKSFVKFRKALSNRHYHAAARELVDSRWARQVSRARVEWSVGVLKSMGGK